MSKISNLFAARDMTVGTPWKNILQFAIPMLIGNIVQQLYNTVDSIVVGKYVGDNALAAVGSAMPIFNLLLVLFMGIATGAGIMVSQYFGAKDREGLSASIGNCITLTAISAVFIMIVGPLISRPLLELLDTPASIIDWCEGYLNIFFIGIAGSNYYNIFSGMLRGMGDSFSSLLYLLVACLLNIVLDVWFVAGLGLGVPGVALATIIAQFVSAVLCFFRLKAMTNEFDMKLKYLAPHKQYMTSVIRLGLPSGITQAIFSLAMIAVQSLTNSFGEMVIACNVIVMRIDGFAMMPIFSFGMALTTYVGQNIGAGQIERVEKGAKQGIFVTLAVTVVMVAGILIFGRALMRLFTNTPEVIDYSSSMIRLLACGYLFMAVTQVLSGAMRGAGDTMSPMWVSLITTVVIRLPLAYGLAYLFPGVPDVIFISLLAVWVLGAFITAIIYKRGKWKTKGITGRGPIMEG